jgi:hypothetical protein
MCGVQKMKKFYVRGQIMTIRGCLSGKTVYFYGKCGEPPVKTVFYRRFTGQQPDADRSYTLALRKLSATGMIMSRGGNVLRWKTPSNATCAAVEMNILLCMKLWHVSCSFMPICQSAFIHPKVIEPLSSGM